MSSFYFAPNAPILQRSGIFGLPYLADDAYIHIVPVPWEVTASYGATTAAAPEAIKKASRQVDLSDRLYLNQWQRGYFYQPLPEKIALLNDNLRAKAELVMEHTSSDRKVADDKNVSKALQEVESGSNEVNKWVYATTSQLMVSKKRVVLLGGEHSIAYGYLKALSEMHDSFGMLVIDAHLDCRKSYQQFTHSHASIMYNVLENIPQIESIAFIGVRDYCNEEKAYIGNWSSRISVYYDQEIAFRHYEGHLWNTIVEEIVQKLPAKLYISFDIDGLDPKLCPHAGTPVMGGMDIHRISYLLHQVVLSGRAIIGADLCEVGHSHTSEWDANVGARVLYQLCNIIS